ncbi:hypothetical protein [Glycomyces tenuis]|uniref:hypothetical protein n=1 Tax=Glycomyces tenuis TaxID=58116 RepID=UPI0003FC3925|nr:hypothetical protein [Glycomyces tenuis]
MGGRKIDPDEIRSVADKEVEHVAELYDDLVSLTAGAGVARDGAFSDSKGKIHAFGDTWDQCFKLFYNCLYETAAASESYKKALKQVAEVAEDDEAMFEPSFEDAMDGELHSEYETAEEQVKDQGIDPGTEEADIYDLEEAPNSQNEGPR